MFLAIPRHVEFHRSRLRPISGAPIMNMTSDALLAQLVCTSASKINEICLEWYRQLEDLSKSVQELGANEHIHACGEALRLYQAVKPMFFIRSTYFACVWESIDFLSLETLQTHKAWQTSLFELAVYLLSALPGHDIGASEIRKTLQNHPVTANTPSSDGWSEQLMRGTGEGNVWTATIIALRAYFRATVLVQQLDMLADYTAIIYVDVKAMVNRGCLKALLTLEQMRRMPFGHGKALQDRLNDEAIILEESNSAEVPVLVLNDAKQALRSIQVDQPSIAAWSRDGKSSFLAQQVKEAMRAVRAVKVAVLTGRVFKWRQLHALCQRSSSPSPSPSLSSLDLISKAVNVTEGIATTACGIDSSDCEGDSILTTCEMQSSLRESRSWFPEDVDEDLPDSEQSVLGDATNEDTQAQQSWCEMWCPCLGIF